VVLGDGDPSRWQDDRWFADGHHMTRQGAGRFSYEVALALEQLAWP